MDEIMEEEEFEQDFDLHQQEDENLNSSLDDEESDDEGPDRYPLFEAVIEDDLSTVKSLIESGHSINSINEDGDIFLLHIIKHERIEIFDYILSLEELEIDKTDFYWRTALHHAVAEESINEYFALQLIDKGANIHQTDDGGLTILHIAICNKGAYLIKLGNLLIKKGVDVNAQDRCGKTPLYVACEEGNFDWIYMLLYYGAFATIPSDDGVLPVAVLSPPSMGIRKEDHDLLLETLVNFTYFEADTVKLPTLVRAMAQDSLLFPKLVEIISEVDYELFDLTYLYEFLIQCKLKTENFKLFVDKFSNILRDMIQNSSESPLEMLTDYYRIVYQSVFGKLESIEVRVGLIVTILESNCVDEFVQNSDQVHPKIGRLIELLYSIPHMCIEEVTKMICLMLSHGVSVTSEDLEIAYDLCGGNSELFKILLHMEINKSSIDGRRKGGSSIVELYYDPSTDIEIFFDNTVWLYSGHGCDLLSYYNLPTLKKLGLTDTADRETLAKAESLPPVPSLLELSRNMTRKFIINRYKIKNSMQFYTVLRWLPINEIYKKIIALEKKLY